MRLCCSYLKIKICRFGKICWLFLKGCINFCKALKSAMANYGR